MASRNSCVYHEPVVSQEHEKEFAETSHDLPEQTGSVGKSYKERDQWKTQRNQTVAQNGIVQNGMTIAMVLLFSKPDLPLFLKKPIGPEAKPKNCFFTPLRKHQIAWKSVHH